MENTVQHPQESFTVPSLNVHDLVTHLIIEQLEAGTAPWQKPWKIGNSTPLCIPKNFITGKKYQGINILLLWSSVIKNNFQTSEWGSYKQWQQKKECIRKGEKGSLIVYYDTFEKEVDGEIKNIPFLKSSYVFNRSQLVSYAPTTEKEHEALNPLFEKIYPVEDFILNTQAIVEHRHDGAAYLPSQDFIVMPYTEYFQSTEACTATEGYYSTLLHELTHWTGNSKRLNRNLCNRFGDKDYAFEELVAELGAAFLCAEFEITSAPKADHASYIGHWLEVLKENKYYIFKAASEASKAVNYLQDLQPKE